MRSSYIANKRRLRAVCAPHSRSTGTSMAPKLSVSIRVAGTASASGLPGSAQDLSRLRSIQAFFSCTCMRWVSRSSVGSSLALSASGSTERAVRTIAS